MSVGSWVFVHSGQLRLGAAGDLLCSQLHELRLELIELLLQVVLVLSPERSDLDFGCGRLSRAC